MMMLNKEQKETLKENIINLIDLIMELIEDKDLRINIAVPTYFNDYGGLVLKICGNGISYETNKTRSHVYVRWDEENSMYGMFKNNNFYHTKIALDMLKSKKKIIEEIKETIKVRDKLLNEILG